MPQNELNRLEAVNQFLQIKIDRNEEIQDILNLAAEICGVPKGLITLVSDDTEYVFSGNSFAYSSGRDASFCHYVLESDAVMVVNDASQDSRLKSYPAVKRKAGIRFYAGAPLTTHDGHRLGSLCVVDQKPGDLSALQQEMLQNLAAQVIQLLEFESNLKLLKDQFLEVKKLELKMRSFFDSTYASHLLLDKNLRILAFNKAVYLFIKKAYDLDIYEGMEVTQFIDEVYMTDFIENCRKALSGQSIRRERLLNFGETELWCMLSYDPARNSSGEIIGISHNAVDITELKTQQRTAFEGQQQLEHIAYIQSHEFRRPVASIKGIIHLLDLDGEFQHCEVIEKIRNAITEIDDSVIRVIEHSSS